MALENLLTLLKNLIIFSSYMTEKSSFPKPLSKEKEQEYLLLSAKGDKEAKEILVKHNLRLVAHIAKNTRTTATTTNSFQSVLSGL